MSFTYPAVLLASRSPRRRELLEQLGIAYAVLDVVVDESVLEGEAPAVYAERVARQKALAGRIQCTHDPRPVLAADTCVVLDDVILGQADSPTSAAGMLQQLSGRSHRVITALVVDHAKQQSLRLVSTQVWFRELSASEIAAYSQSSEPIGKAGAYAIQGSAAAFIERIEGSYSAVVGLPLFELAELLRAPNV